MASPHEPIPAVSVGGRLSPSPLCPSSKTPRTTTYSEGPPLATSVILSPASSSFGGPGSKGREYGKELVTLGLNDDEDDDNYLRTSSHFAELPAADTVFSPSASVPSLPPPGLVIEPPSFSPPLTEPSARYTPMNDTHIGMTGTRDIRTPSLQSSSLPTGSPVPSTRWKESRMGRLRKAPPPAVAPAYASSIGKRAPSGYQRSPYLCRGPPSGRQSRMGFRIRDLPSMTADATDVSGGGNSNYEFGTRPRENIVEVQVSKERESVRRLATNVPLRASEALNMLECSPHQRGATPLQSPPRRPLTSHPSPFRQQHPFPPSNLSLAQRQNESENDPANYISTELALNSILEHHKYSGHSQEDRLACAHLLNLDAVPAPAPAVFESVGQSSLQQPQPAHGHKRAFIPLSPSEEFLADLQGDPFASVPSTPRPTTGGTIRSAGGKESTYTTSYTSLSTPSSPAFPPSVASLALPFPPASRFRRISNSDVSVLGGDNDSVARIRSVTASHTSVPPPMRTDEIGRPFIGLGVALGIGSTFNSSSQSLSRSSPRFPPAGLPHGVQSPRGPKQGNRRPSTASGALERVHAVPTTLPTSPRLHPTPQASGRDITQTMDTKRQPRSPPDPSFPAGDDHSNVPLPGPGSSMPSSGDHPSLSFSKTPSDTPAPAPPQVRDSDDVVLDIGASASIGDPIGSGRRDSVDFVPRQHPDSGPGDFTLSEATIEGEILVVSPPCHVDSVPTADVNGGGIAM